MVAATAPRIQCKQDDVLTIRGLTSCVSGLSPDRVRWTTATTRLNRNQISSYLELL